MKRKQDYISESEVKHIESEFTRIVGELVEESQALTEHIHAEMKRL